MLLQPVILSGGSGTRLWPLSREAYPKQFLPLQGELSLLQATVRRLEGLTQEHPHLGIGLIDPILVCNDEHRFIVAEQMRALKTDPSAIILEPEGRNTAPALTLGALWASRDNEDPVLLVMPADHLIRDEVEFRRVVALGHGLAEDGAVVTFGIRPNTAETGYGYLLCGDPHPKVKEAGLLAAFVEKPDRATAETYVASGAYLWNSGIFMLRASIWLQLIERYRADIAAACKNAFAAATTDLHFFRPETQAFHRCPPDSIDYAVMEKIAGHRDEKVDVVILPLAAGWSDVGAWSALWEVSAQDASGNVSEGDTLLFDSRNTLAIARRRMLAVLGVENLVIVETPDVVLVMDKARSQEVRVVTQYLKQTRRSEVRYHQKMHRPWGTYEPIDHGERYQVKRLTVNPGASLSLQMHHHRAEHWIVVRGTARVTRDEEVYLLTENQSTYIPLGARHRLENPGHIPLEIIEVQSGSYLDEDDIVRFVDIYHRG